jgi:hypothetical protein
MTKRILVATVALLVSRDAMTTLPVTVPTHELEIQKAVFGEDNVEVRDIETAPAAITVEEEAVRLVGKYGAQAIEAAYGVNFKGAITKAAAAAKVGDAPDEDDGSLGGFNGTGEIVVPGANPEGLDADAELLTMTKDALLKYAAANGIDTVKPAMKKDEILAEIAAANRS